MAVVEGVAQEVLCNIFIEPDQILFPDLQPLIYFVHAGVVQKAVYRDGTGAQQLQRRRQLFDQPD